ncbi:uncharacterized protein LOC122672546 [Telopea speciosissima]|uniref:uncharacterized protein LOC122672546 n=1 Tax=Telopea speciosissima TaxID=54955 RepID=UPI001CC76E9A|nr:uncharacterized protein LOC122672546 [Telopea speciosissima]
MQACRDHAIAASVTALKKALDPKTDPKTASSLKDCKASYDDALDNLKTAEDALKTVDLGTVNSMLSSALTDFSDCDDYFSPGGDGPGDGPIDSPSGGTEVQGPMTKEDGTLVSLASNCLAIASLVK